MQRFSDYYNSNMQTEGLKHIIPSILTGAILLGAPMKVDASTTTPTTQTAPAKLNFNTSVVAATLVGEAGGEGIEGMHAVLNVIMNRAKNDFSKAGAVCLKKKQFSMWNGKDRNAVITKAQKHPNWKQALLLIKDAQQGGRLKDITSGATFYYAQKKVTPSWLPAMQKTVVIGNHTFCKPKAKKTT